MVGAGAAVDVCAKGFAVGCITLAVWTFDIKGDCCADRSQCAIGEVAGPCVFYIDGVTLVDREGIEHAEVVDESVTAVLRL